MDLNEFERLCSVGAKCIGPETTTGKRPAEDDSESLDSKKQRVAALQTEIEDFEQQRNLHFKELRDLSKKQEDKKKQLENAKKEIEIKEKEEKDIQAILKELEEDMRKGGLEAWKEHNRDVRTIREKHDKQKLDMEELQKSLKILEDANDTLNGEYAECNIKINKCEENMTKLQNEIDVLTKSNCQNQSQHTDTNQVYNENVVRPRKGETTFSSIIEEYWKEGKSFYHFNEKFKSDTLIRKDLQKIFEQMHINFDFDVELLEVRIPQKNYRRNMPGPPYFWINFLDTYRDGLRLIRDEKTSFEHLKLFCKVVKEVLICKPEKVSNSRFWMHWQDMKAHFEGNDSDFDDLYNYTDVLLQLVYNPSLSLGEASSMIPSEFKQSFDELKEKLEEENKRLIEELDKRLAYAELYWFGPFPDHGPNASLLEENIFKKFKNFPTYWLNERFHDILELFSEDNDNENNLEYIYVFNILPFLRKIKEKDGGNFTLSKKNQNMLKDFEKKTIRKDK